MLIRKGLIVLSFYGCAFAIGFSPFRSDVLVMANELITNGERVNGEQVNGKRANNERRTSKWRTSKWQMS